MKKFLTICIIMFLSVCNACFASGLSSEINNVISKSGINRSAITISIKNVKTGDYIYYVILIIILVCIVNIVLSIRRKSKNEKK